MDYLTLETLVGELAPRLCNARIDKIQQPAKDRILLKVFNGRENFRLVLDVTPGAAHLLEVSGGQPVPQRPPRFCQLLRARFRRIERLELIAGERLLVFHGMSLSGEKCALVMELMGAVTNLVLLRPDGTIIDALRRSTPEEIRLIKAGEAYPFPKQTERVPLKEASQKSAEWTTAKDLLHHINPMTPLLAEALLVRAAELGEGGLALALEEAAEDYAASEPEIDIGTFRGKTYLSVFPFTRQILEQAQSYPSLMEALSVLWGGAESQPSGSRSEKDQLQLSVRRHLKKVSKRLEDIARDEEKALNQGRWQLYGNLLLANLYQIQKGQTEVTLINYETEPAEEVRVPLDPTKTPQQNAESYYTRSKKIQRGTAHRERRLRETLEERDYLEQVLLSLQEAQTTDDIQWIRHELQEAGYLRQPTKTQRRIPLRTDALRSLDTPEGNRLWWGTNNRLNDLLLREVARADDYWFHAHDLPGSHVVLRNQGGGALSEDEITLGARVAAGFSKGKNDEYVEVKCSQVKFLRRTKGGRPGFVLVDKFTTLRVPPLRPGEGNGVA